MAVSTDLCSLLPALRALRDRPAGAGALVTMIRTHGSAFRRPGARMLVDATGRVENMISGGCPAADMIERARRAIAEDRRSIVTYDRTHAYDVLLEAGCGGGLQVLIEPVFADRDRAFIDALERGIGRRRPLALATVLPPLGAPMTGASATRALWCDGIAYESSTDAAVREALSRAAVLGARGAPPNVLRLGTESGEAEVFVEPIETPLRLVLVGRSPVALALSRLAQLLGWEAVLVLGRGQPPPGPEWTIATVEAEPETLCDRLPMDARSCVLAMTFNLERDIAYLRPLADLPLAYCGSLGSRGRARSLREALPPEFPLNVPAGLDIGSETAEEIALSIAAQIVASLNQRSGAELHRTSAPLHASAT